MSSKKIIWTILLAVLIAAVIAAVCIGTKIAPTVNHGLRISELLQPLMDAENQSVHIEVSAKVDGESIDLDTDVYVITEGGISFLAVQQAGTTVYVADNLLFLENGKAFKISDKLLLQKESCQNLIPNIGALYESLKIKAEDTEKETIYSVAVTGQQLDSLLAAASFGETLPVAEIKTLNVQLTEQNGNLEQVRFSGSGVLNDTPVSLEVTLSNFQILSPGAYPIPEAVKQSAATVDPNGLFSLTEDLYRLVVALAPFGDMESLDGTLALLVDCGILQLDTEINLSDLRTFSVDQVDPEKLQALPEMLGWLCMEGDIRCSQEGSAYVYSLELDAQAMQQLAGMILPELGQNPVKPTEGSVRIIIENKSVVSMKVSVEGKITTLIAQIPIKLVAEFTFG